MKGAARAAERQRDDYTTMAYQAAAFRGVSQTKRGLPPLNKYLIHKPETPRAETGAEMLAALRHLGRRSNMTITRREIN